MPRARFQADVPSEPDADPRTLADEPQRVGDDVHLVELQGDAVARGERIGIEVAGREGAGRRRGSQRDALSVSRLVELGASGVRGWSELASDLCRHVALPMTTPSVPSGLMACA